jgi:hypothetical protein
MTVGEMLAKMTSMEFTEWKVFFNLEPFGDMRADLRAGMIAAPLLNIWKKRGSSPAHPSKWILDFDSVNKTTDPDSIKMLFQFIAYTHKEKP